MFCCCIACHQIKSKLSRSFTMLITSSKFIPVMFYLILLRNCVIEWCLRFLLLFFFANSILSCPWISLFSFPMCTLIFCFSLFAPDVLDPSKVAHLVSFPSFHLISSHLIFFLSSHLLSSHLLPFISSHLISFLSSPLISFPSFHLLSSHLLPFIFFHLNSSHPHPFRFITFQII